MMKSALAVTDPAPINWFDLDQQAMERLFVQIGEKPFRASQLLKWMHQHSVTDFEAMSNLSKAFRKKLAIMGDIRVPKVVVRQQSKDGTRKWLLQTDCNNGIETVYIPDRGRGTLCISSQIGCSLTCSFCSTAQQGYNRNLSTAEIIGQLWVAKQELGTDNPVTNVVMMGMGEPLMNFESVVGAMNLMMGDFAYGLSKRRVTLSTSGVVPMIDRLREVSDVALAISLHACNDALRDQLVPINRKYPIHELLAACKRYFAGTNRKITIEYVMLDGINDTAKDARALCRLLSYIPSKINLIPFNPFPGTTYRCSRPEAISAFREILQQAGFVITTRKTRGEDIDAACGQLVGKVQDRGSRQKKFQRTAVIAS